MREKVKTAARQLGLDVDVHTLERPTRTVAEAADAVGCSEAQIAKSIVFIADGEPVVCIASGEHRIDADLLCEVIDCAEARPATPAEVRAATGFSVGGVAPFAHGLPVVFDAALLRHDRIWAAAGDGNSVFCVDPNELVRCTGATVANVEA